MMTLGLRRQKQREAELEQRKHVQDSVAIERRKEAAVELERSAHAAATGLAGTASVIQAKAICSRTASCAISVLNR